MSAFTWPPDASASASFAAPGTGEPVAAAVLVPMFLAPDGDEPHVVLTRRRADLRRHAGEISFPGGRRDAEDPTLTDTALREAEEEIGLPRADVTLLGELPHLDVRHRLHHPPVRGHDPREHRLASVGARGGCRAGAPTRGRTRRPHANHHGTPRHHLRNRRLHRRRPPHLGRDRTNPRAPLRASRATRRERRPPGPDHASLSYPPVRHSHKPAEPTRRPTGLPCRASGRTVGAGESRP